MNPIIVSLIIFIFTVGMLILNIIDRVSTVLLGAILMVLTGVLSPIKAFQYIDWNVIGILLGMWIITQYMVEAKIPDYIVYKVSSKTKSYKTFVIVLFILSGFISMFVDNVLVILLLGTILIRASLHWRKDPVLPVILIGLAANYMGTALLLGDLPPQLLHTIGGAEFNDFIYMTGKPSSFPLLALSFLLTTVIVWRLIPSDKEIRTADSFGGKPYINTGLSIISFSYFILTVLLMSIRARLGVPLGFITITTASMLAATAEFLRKTKTVESPEFSLIIERLEWRAVLFYIALFVLVGGIDQSGFIPLVAEKIARVAVSSPSHGYTLLYWSSAAASSIVEHDAYILALFRAVKEASLYASINPWPLYWAVAWGGTIGSNASVAGAPALYVALSLLEREGFRVGAWKFTKTTVSFTLVSSVITFIITYLVWGA